MTISDYMKGWTVWGLNHGRGQEIFLFSKMARPDLEPTLPPIQCVLLGLKWPGYDVNYSPPPSAEVTNEYRYISTPPYVFMAWKGKSLPLYELVTIYKWSFFKGTNVVTRLRKQ